MKRKKTWQADENATWYTNHRPICDSCGEEVDIVIENKDGSRACFGSGHCLVEAVKYWFDKEPDAEFLWIRMVMYKNTGD